MPTLILASASPSRLAMLRSAGVAVRAVGSHVSEVSDLMDPGDRAVALALRKARAVADTAGDAVVLGADQVAYCDGAVFGKPVDSDDHLARLRTLRSRTHSLVTGWALVGPHGEVTGRCVTALHGRPDVTDAELAQYVASGEGTYCAGGYAIEGRGALLFRRIEGDYFNVLGLPLLDVLGALRSLGWRADEAEG